MRSDFSLNTAFYPLPAPDGSLSISIRPLSMMSEPKIGAFLSPFFFILAGHATLTWLTLFPTTFTGIHLQDAGERRLPGVRATQGTIRGNFPRRSCGGAARICHGRRTGVGAIHSRRGFREWQQAAGRVIRLGAEPSRVGSRTACEARFSKVVPIPKHSTSKALG